MLIEVKRFEFNDTYTVGRMYLNNVYFYAGKNKELNKQKFECYLTKKIMVT
jgi:hypothetical protein